MCVGVGHHGRLFRDVGHGGNAVHLYITPLKGKYGTLAVETPVAFVDGQLGAKQLGHAAFQLVGGGHEMTTVSRKTKEERHRKDNERKIMA